MEEMTKKEEKVVDETVEREKPYKFRALAAPDAFPMLKIISLIGINEFMMCFKNEEVKNTILTLFKKNKDKKDEDKKDEDKKDMISIVGITVALEITNVIMGNLPKCETYIFQLLSQTSNLSVDEVKALSFADFMEMIIDFVKKEEFVDFIQVVSRQFK